MRSVYYVMIEGKAAQISNYNSGYDYKIYYFKYRFLVLPINL